MTQEQRIKNLTSPKGRVDVVLDTDAYNEIDDQFAIAYLLKNKEKLNTKALYAAPFYNHHSSGPADGMELSYNEILKLLDLMGESVEVFRGSPAYLADEKTPIASPAALDLAERVKSYSPENPLYVVAIGAITNIASAILINPQVAENTVIVWLGGNAHHFRDTAEFNMRQDVAAARVVMGSGAPFVQLPCMGVVSSFTVSKPELEYWLIGKSPIATYLAENAINEAESYAKGTPWTRVIWDVTAIAWLIDDCGSGGKWLMESRLTPTALPSYDNHYQISPDAPLMRYVYHINRDNLMKDLFDKISN